MSDYVHYNEQEMKVFISKNASEEGYTKLGSVDQMPENPKLVVHMMLKRANLPTSGWTINNKNDPAE